MITEAPCRVWVGSPGRVVCPPLEMCPQQPDGHSVGLLQRSSRNEPWVGLGRCPHSSPVLTPTAQSHRVPHAGSHCPRMQSTPSIRTLAGTAALPGFESGASSLMPGGWRYLSLARCRGTVVTRSCKITEREAGPGLGSGLWAPRPPAA